MDEDGGATTPEDGESRNSLRAWNKSAGNIYSTDQSRSRKSIMESAKSPLRGSSQAKTKSRLLSMRSPVGPLTKATCKGHFASPLDAHAGEGRPPRDLAAGVKRLSPASRTLVIRCCLVDS